jgi:predicted DNA-binding WGR domain protein
MKRHLTFTDGTSAKFWEVSLEGHSLITRYGKIGTDGKSLVKSFDSPQQARVAMDQQTRQKLSKGYEELDAAITPKTNADKTVYLELQQRFFEIFEDNNQMRIRRGEIGKPCLEYRLGWTTPNRGRENFKRLVKTWKEQGFKVTQPSTEIIKGCLAGQLWTNEILDHPVYSQFFDQGWAGELRDKTRRLIHFPNGLQYDGDFDLEEIADMKLGSGLIIEGDVRVSGVFSQLTYTYPGSTLITGNVYAHSLGHKDSYMRIEGNVHVENVVYGEYNDGSLEIAGDVYGQVWISADHNMWAGGTYHLPTFHDETEGLSPKVLTLEGRLDWDALREFIFARKSPLHKDFVFISPEPEPIIEEAQTSELYKQVRTLAEVEDVEGLTQLLETWREHDHEWQEFVQARLAAPSSTPVQQKRLRAALELPPRFATEISVKPVVQIETFEEANPEIQRIINIMNKGAKQTLKALENPPAPELFPPHSHVLLINAMLENLDTQGAFLPVIERLLELRVNPCYEDSTGRILVDDSLLWKQFDIAELFRKYYPDANIWTIPTSGQVQEPEEAHPKILEFLNLPGWEQRLEALETPPDEDLIQSHSWLLLINLIQRADALDDDYVNVIELLLILGADPRVSFEGMNMSVVQQAKRLADDDVLALFYRRYPELRPEEKPEDTVYGVEVLNKLIQLEDAGTDFEDAEIKRNWLEPIFQLSVFLGKLKRIPESLGKLQSLKSLSLTMIEPVGQKLPVSLGQLVNLEHLLLGVNGFTDLPDLSGLTKLKKLLLHANKFKRLTTFPINLEQLFLDLNPLDESPNLSALTNLKHLSLDGIKVIPVGLENLMNLEELHWADADLDTFPKELAKLPKLRELVMSGNRFVTPPDLQDLHELEVLDLQNCRLERLPEGLLDLPKLKQLLLAGNRKLEVLVDKTKDAASLEILEALRARGVAFTTENSEDSEASETSQPKKKDTHTRKALKQVKALNQNASNAQTHLPPKSVEALTDFKQVLELAKPFLEDFPDDFAYEYLFALQGKLWCINELAEQDPTQIPEAIELAEFILEFTQTQFNLYYSEAGQLSRSAQTLAHNALSWYLLQAGTDLNKALEHVNTAIEELDYSSEDETHAVVLENKVKILLALERSDDAYAVVYQMHRGFPELPFFKQLTQTLEYQQWDAEN